MSLQGDIDPEFRDDVADCLLQQLQELELLQAMYPSPGEFQLTDANTIQLIRDYIEHRSEYAPRHIDFTVMLCVGKLKIEVCIDLPSMYPLEEPDILVRCNQLNRKQQTELNSEMVEFLRTVPKGESCIYSLIMWLQDNIENFWVDVDSPMNEQETMKTASSETFARFWVYSHHIYNKRKRDEIVSNAKELNLTGFCLPGKPGIICVEGKEANCKEWWRIIKSMTWKKIVIRKTEIEEMCTVAEKRKFDKFVVHFQNPSNKNSKHMDMGQFSKYMEEHGLSGAFNDFFGLCNE